MSVYVLLHGSWHGGWCWDKVARGLEQRGHRAVAPDLPGHGQDKADAAAQTLASYVDTMCRVLDREPEPVVLVAHSMGGVTATQTAELRADKIRALVYLCAFLPRSGESGLQLAQTDTESRILPNLVVDQERGLHWVREEARKDVFYHDCSDEDAEAALSKLVLEPLAPIATPVEVSQESYGRVPRAYIECTEDRAIGISLQRRMVAASPCKQVVSLPTGHSPFLSAPEVLTEHLIRVAEEP